MTLPWSDEDLDPWQRDLTLAEWILSYGCIDWVYAGQVCDLVRRSGARDPDDARDLAVGLIARLVFAGLAVPGDVWDRHTPWTTSPAESVRRIAVDWAAFANPFVRPGDVVWLENTPAGNLIGEEVLRRNPDYVPLRKGVP
jgi:hypothetical protein